jgi:hypothetical protein
MEQNTSSSTINDISLTTASNVGFTGFTTPTFRPSQNSVKSNQFRHPLTTLLSNFLVDITTSL